MNVLFRATSFKPPVPAEAAADAAVDAADAAAEAAADGADDVVALSHAATINATIAKPDNQVAGLAWRGRRYIG